jgi:hypothetical protein
MQYDLLDAYAAVDWTIAQFPAFDQKIRDWLGANLKAVIEDQPAPATHDVFVMVEKEPLPRAFNVEVGAYINVIRSSLDILASAIGRRHTVLYPDKFYFPVANSAADFAAGNYRGSELINGLPADARKIFEDLKPYNGGNELLWLLHQMDITRKHQRLIEVEVRPAQFSIVGLRRDDFTPVSTGIMRADEKTVLGLIRKGSPHSKIQVMPFVAFSTGRFGGEPVVASLIRFANFARLTIEMFE